MAKVDVWIKKLENALNGLKDYELIVVGSIYIVPKGTWDRFFDATGCNSPFDTWLDEEEIEVYAVSGKARIIPYGESE